MNKKYNKNQGFTLIELSVTMGVAMILMSIAVPSLNSTLQRNKITALHNKILSSLNFARSTAISTGSWATFCHSNAAGTACESPTDSIWTNGWIVFSDKNKNGLIDGNERILSAISGVPSGITIVANRHRVIYGSQGYAVGYAGRIALCAKANDNYKQGMIISANGRVRKASTNDSLLDCPSST